MLSVCGVIFTALPSVPLSVGMLTLTEGAFPIPRVKFSAPSASLTGSTRICVNSGIMRAYARVVPISIKLHALQHRLQKGQQQMEKQLQHGHLNAMHSVETTRINTGTIRAATPNNVFTFEIASGIVLNDRTDDSCGTMPEMLAEAFSTC